MNIRDRIMLLVVLAFLAIASIGGFAVYQGRGSAKEVKTVTQGVVPSALASAELVGQLKDVQLSVMVIVSAADMKLAEQAEERLLATQGRLQKAFDDQMAQATSDAQRGLVVQAKENLGNYFAAIKETVDLKLKGQKELAEANLAANVGGYLQEMEAVIDTLQIEKRRSKDDAIQAMNENLSGTSSTIAVVTVFAVLVLGGVGMLLYRQIILPMAEMESKMTEIATSQDFSQRLPVQRMDEIGHSMQAFNIMVEKIQESTELVRQKTADIHAMLHYVPQGILTIEANNRIHPEYSEFLETILNSHEIAGRSLMDVLFTGTDCNADQLSQIETVTSACIGEDEMNFDFNAHLLPVEITKTMLNGEAKILDLNWSPISDESGTTLRILLCVRDVTEMRALASEAQVQKRELNIIGEILSVQQEKFHEFAAGASRFIAENRQLIENTSEKSAFAERQPVITQLFRNMHTIKGNARTYGLLHLTHVVHETEQNYESLRASEYTVWDRDYLLQQLDATELALQEYVHINEVKLGRKGPGRRGDAENYLMVEKQRIADTLTLLERAYGASGDAQRDALRHIRHSLELMGTQSIEDVLASVLESLPALARELGKEAPTTPISSNGIVLRSQVSAMLKNVCMHLYRNAVDHGLESAAERVALGKTPAGNVHLSLNMQGEQLAIRLQDDGRGLAIAHIRRKAIERNLIAEGLELSDEQIAQIVLQPGFSTAEQVTEVSGRGVGMDAVKGFVEAFGGSLSLNLLDERTDSEYRRFETLIRLPGKFALAPALRLLRQTA